MEKTCFLVCILIFSIVLISCNPNAGPHPEEYDRISGFVVDSLTNLPIDSAQIIIGDTLSSSLITYTNNEGWFTKIPDTFGIVDVYCRKTDYLTKKKTVDLTVDYLIINDFNFKLQK